MRKKKGFTLIELLVVIAIIAMLLAILMPALNKVKKIAQRVVCGTNLKGLGTAQNVYANDYEDQFARQGGTRPLNWMQKTFQYANPANGWSGTEPRDITVGASLYLLVREADVSPKSFVCSAGGQNAYDGKNPNNLDLVELWDFGAPDFGNTGPSNCVSYAYQDPYGRYPPSGAATASFGMMADKNPFFDPKLEWEAPGVAGQADTWSSKIVRLGAYWTTAGAQKWEIQRANAYAHSREGQNVLFGDGHCNYEKVSDCGVRNDNIYTKQNPVADVNNEYIRCGFSGRDVYYIKSVCLVANVHTGSGLEPTNGEDSLLVNDDFHH